MAMSKKSKLLQDIYKNKLILATLIFISLSLICLLIILIGGLNGSVDLNTFSFDETVSTILQRKSIKFTLLGYCIDYKCTKEQSHNFDRVPTAQEIQTGEVIKPLKRSVYNRLDADTVKNKVASKINEAANKGAESIKNVTVNALLSAFDNFIPKEPTSNISLWVARPIIAAAVFNTISLFLLTFTNEKNRILCYLSTLILLIISFILNAASFFVTLSLFSLVFNVIGSFPGIGDNRVGPAMYLSCMSACFLFISLNLLVLENLLHKNSSSTQKFYV